MPLFTGRLAGGGVSTLPFGDPAHRVGLPDPADRQVHPQIPVESRLGRTTLLLAQTSVACMDGPTFAGGGCVTIPPFPGVAPRFPTASPASPTSPHPKVWENRINGRSDCWWTPYGPFSIFKEPVPQRGQTPFASTGRNLTPPPSICQAPFFGG